MAQPSDQCPIEPAWSDRRLDRRRVVAWALLEFSLALWGAAVVTVHVPLMVVQDLGGSDGDVAVATSVAVAIIAMLGPAVGSLSDRASGRIPFAVAALVVCALPTVTLGAAGLGWTLTAFVVAFVGQGLGLLFVDVLLPSVSGEEQRGRVGGLGVAAGLLGAFAGIGLGLGILAIAPGARTLVFQAAALALLALGLPALAMLRRAPATSTPDATGLSRRSMVDRLRAAPGFVRLLVAHFFYADAAATMTAFTAIYAVREIGFSETQAQLVLLAGLAGGIGGGLVVGVAADRRGAKHALTAMLWLWLAVFAGAAAIPLLDLPRELFWLIGTTAGFALGGAWAADRPLALSLVPGAALGQMMGLYSAVGRAAAVVGPMLWALVVERLGWGRPVAVLVLGAMTITALAVLRPLRSLSDCPPVGDPRAR